MNRIGRPKEGRQNQRGAALAMTGMAMILLVGMAVLGVDVGHLAFTANETQVLADLSATSYAKTLAKNLDDGGTRNPVTETSAVIQQNAIGGVPATLSNIESFQTGNYNTQTRTFTVGGNPVNAVRANAIATVPNFFAGIFGDMNSTVRRNATAALTPPGRAPVLPMAIGECWWDIFETTGSCSSQPTFTQIPSPTDNTCWTSLTPNSGDANNNWFRDVILKLCGLRTGSTPAVGEGDIIAFNNGQTNALAALKECVDAGVTEYVVPVVPCNKCTQSDAILGFATINITHVQATGNNKGVTASAVCSTDPPGATGGGSGGTNTGTLLVTMVN